MKLLIIYSVFASPLLLLPLLNTGNVFALANADIIYNILHSLGIPVVSSGILISASGYSISIASTCTDIGAFVALAMFLIPIAYLFDGKMKRKVLWVISGIALMLLLNILRMASIALEWAYYGISNAIALFHIFIGPVLFYITIIVMILISYKFRLSIPQINSRGIKIKAYAPYLLALCVVFGIIGFFFTLPYQNLIYAPIINFNNQQIANQSGIMLDRYVLLTLENAKMNITQMAGNTSDLIFALSRKNLTSPIYVLVNYSTRPNIENIKLKNSSVEMSTSLLKNGIAVTGGTVTSYNSTYNNTLSFAFDYFTIPYNMSGREFSLRYFFFKEINKNQSVSDCQNYTSINSVGPINYIDSFIYNAANSESLNSPNGICAAYAVANNATG
jgi:exosortase/archaeosortase family protein